MLESYRKHVEERAALGVPPKALDADQTAALVERVKNPPAGDEKFILDLLSNRVPAGVDQAAYVKAGFLAAIAKGEAESPLVDKVKAVELLGTMLGGLQHRAVDRCTGRRHAGADCCQSPVPHPADVRRLLRRERENGCGQRIRQAGG